MCAARLCCYGGKIKVESWDYVSISAVSARRRCRRREKEERLHDKHLSWRLSRRSRHPAGASMSRGAFSRYCTFQSQDGGEIWRQYSQTPPLWRILTWKQTRIQKKPGYKWNTTWLYSQYSAFPLKIQIWGFFSPGVRRVAVYSLFRTHQWNATLQRRSSSFLVSQTRFYLRIVFFITLEGIKKAALIPVHKDGESK